MKSCELTNPVLNWCRAWKQHLSKTDKPPENFVKQSNKVSTSAQIKLLQRYVLTGHSSQSLASETRKWIAPHTRWNGPKTRVDLVKTWRASQEVLCRILKTSAEKAADQHKIKRQFSAYFASETRKSIHSEFSNNNTWIWPTHEPMLTILPEKFQSVNFVPRCNWSLN